MITPQCGSGPSLASTSSSPTKPRRKTGPPTLRHGVRRGRLFHIFSWYKGETEVRTAGAVPILRDLMKTVLPLAKGNLDTRTYAYILNCLVMARKLNHF